MDLVELVSSADALTPEIQKHAINCSASCYTKKYSVRENGKEVGFLALDWWSTRYSTDLNVHEVFVPEQFRHQGVGARILMETEKLARGAGYCRVVLIARPLENYQKRQLRAWYRKHGFKLVSRRADDMAKDLS